MATVDELLDAALARHVHVLNSRPCGACQGEGEVRGFRCAGCDGKGVSAAFKATDLELSGVMGNEVLRYVLSEREAARFGNMNAALDWWQAHVQRMLAEVPQEQLEDIAKLAAAYQQAGVPPPPERIRLGGAALTDAELVELGVTEPGSREPEEP